MGGSLEHRPPGRERIRRRSGGGRLAGVKGGLRLRGGGELEASRSGGGRLAGVEAGSHSCGWRGGGGARGSSVPRGDETDGWEPEGDPIGMGSEEKIWVPSKISGPSRGPTEARFFGPEPHF